MKKKIKAFLLSLALITLMLAGCKSEKEPVITPPEVTDTSGNNAVSTDSNSNTDETAPSGNNTGTGEQAEANNQTESDHQAESDTPAMLDENGNQSESENIDLSKAVSKEYVEQNISYSATMRITINPDLVLYLDRDGIVLAYHYENKDAADAYKDVSFTGNNVKAAIKKVTNAALETDYLKQDADMIIEVAEVKDTSFQINEALYIAEVTANKTLHENHREAAVGVAMSPEVEAIAEEQGEFELENLSEPQDLSYLTDMLDYSATVKIGDDNPVVLFLDAGGMVMAYGFEDRDAGATPALSSPVGQSASEAARAITQNLIEENNATDETVLKIEVLEAIDDFFRTDEFIDDTHNSVQNVLEVNHITATVEVVITADPPKEENSPVTDEHNTAENPVEGNTPEDVCARCLGEKVIPCDRCAALGYINCDTCNNTGVFTCDLCEGEKQIVCTICSGSGYDPAPCRFCKGTGNCPTCGGSGKEMTDQGTEGSCHQCNGHGHCENWFVDHTDICYGHGPCSRCQMTGYETCHRCQGNGTSRCEACSGDGGKTCPDCNGTKLLTCPDCTGNE